MILNLVDRRTGADGASQEFHGERWQRLVRLVAGLGAAAWAVDVVLVDDEGMADLNQRFRNKSGVTDVLSFSYLEFTGPGQPDLAAGEHHAAVDIWAPAGPADADTGAAMGELVLAPGFVGARCLANDWPLGDEIPLLIVHGCLHLMGWDHEDPVEGRQMQDHEVDLLAAEGLAHPLRQRS